MTLARRSAHSNKVDLQVIYLFYLLRLSQIIRVEVARTDPVIPAITALTESGEDRMKRIIAGIEGTIIYPAKPNPKPMIVIPNRAMLLFIV